MSMVELSRANERRVSCAATRRVVQAHQALAVLESCELDLEHSRHGWLWIEVLRLRITHDSASLTDLAAAMSPPMTKDRYAALLRRACQVAKSYQVSSATPPDTARAALAHAAAAPEKNVPDEVSRDALTDNQIEILRQFGHETRWLRPLDLGGSRYSSHSDVLRQLARRGLVESKVRSPGSHHKLYRITAAGARARHVPRSVQRGPLAELIESASRRHGRASDRQLARIAQEGGYKISNSVLSRLRHEVNNLAASRRVAEGSLRAIAFLAQVPESAAYEAAGARTPAEIKQAAAEAARRFQREYLKTVQEQTLPSAVNRRHPWTRSEDQHMLTFMETPGARINDLAKELGRSHAGVTNRLRKLRSQARTATPYNLTTTARTAKPNAARQGRYRCRYIAEAL